MMFKYWKLLFFSSLIMSIFIAISANSWLGMWIGLEINMLSIIPLMNNINPYSTESSLKYFITQAMASTIILFSIIIMSNTFIYSKIFCLIINSAILTKMGSAPFHFWFPEVMEGQSWMNNFIILTFQKIIPFNIINYNLNYSLFFSIIIIMNMMISAFLGINQISLRKILTFSSINHIGWMLASMMFLKTIWIYYFMIYTLISFNLTYVFSTMNTFFIKQLTNMNLTKFTKLMFMINFFSLGGLPPFIGFLPKWLTIQALMFNNSQFLMILMVILTLITLYYYIRVMFSTLMMTSSKKTNFLKFNNFNIMLINFLTMISLIISFLSFTL